MDIELQLFGQLRELAGSAQTVIAVAEGARLTDLVEQLVYQYGTAFGKELNRIKELYIAINGRDYRALNGIETPLKSKDTVAFMPPICGG